MFRQSAGRRGFSSMHRSIVNVLVFGTGCLFLFWLDGCSLPAGGSYAIRVFSPTVDLAWDPPDEQLIPPDTQIVHYDVYVRNHGTIGWRMIAQIPRNSNPAVTLRHSDLGNGAFDFSVKVVTTDGRESALHSSFDVSADPFGGWYLEWY